MPRSMRKGLYRVIYLVKGRRAAVPATLQFDAAMREFAALKRRGFTAWIESDSGEFVPVEGAMRKPKEIVDEQRRHRVADFASLPELIEHAKSVDGASHLLISGRHTKIYFPRQDGRYDEGSVWQQHGYWHAPAPSDRVVVTGLPAGAEPIGSHVQRVGRRAGEARLSETSRRRGAKSALELAGELSRQLNGSKPRIIPGGFRWSEHNEAAQFKTNSPEYGQTVVVVVSTFPDRSVAVDFFGDEGLSETARYENVGHFTYKTTADLPEMVNDVRWVWETVDGYAASWQEDEGGEVDERRRVSDREPSFKRVGARVKYNYTDGPIPAGTLGMVIGFLPKSYQAQIRWDKGTVSNHTPDEYDVVSRGTKVTEAPSSQPMNATDFIALLQSLAPADRQTSVRFQPSIGGERGGGSVYVNFVNLPPGGGSAGGGAEAENNRASFWVEGFLYDPAAPVAKVKVEQSNNVFNRKVPFRAKTGSPDVIARYLTAYLAKVVEAVPPRFTHTTQERARRR